MGFVDAVKSAYNNYAKFEGRASRSEFWWFVLFYMIVAIALSFLAGLIPGVGKIFGILLMVFYIGSIVPFIALAARRMHDTDHSGWFQLIPIYSLYLAIIEGTKGENRFGAPVV